jgi:hypothetical protein
VQRLNIFLMNHNYLKPFRGRQEQLIKQLRCNVFRTSIFAKDEQSPSASEGKKVETFLLHHFKSIEICSARI